VDNKLFDEFFQSTYDRIFKYVSRRISWDAEDVVNDIYVIAWKRKSSMPTMADEQMLWLYAIGRRVIANKIRWKARLDSFNRLNKPLLHTSGASPEDSNSLIMDILVDLPANLREPLLLVEWEGLSVRDAAKLLEISESAITKRLHTARMLFARKYSDLSHSELA
jgi:RNA polymerase sigma-70 factor (ECF subfamily)